MAKRSAGEPNEADEVESLGLETELETKATVEAKPPVMKPKIIVEKYMATRSDIDASLKRVLCTLYKGETHTSDEWDEIVKRRLERPAV